MHKHNKRLKLIIKAELYVLCLLSVLGIILSANSIPSINEAITLATTQKPETFTELYFENHLDLPKTVKPKTPYTFTFTVHNVEYKDMEYSYVVYLQRDDQKIVIDQGSLNLRKDGSQSVKENFGPLKNIRSKIVVELTNQNQQIDFWLDKS